MGSHGIPRKAPSQENEQPEVGNGNEPFWVLCPLKIEVRRTTVAGEPAVTELTMEIERAFSCFGHKLLSKVMCASFNPPISSQLNGLLRGSFSGGNASLLLDLWDTVFSSVWFLTHMMCLCSLSCLLDVVSVLSQACWPQTKVSETVSMWKSSFSEVCLTHFVPVTPKSNIEGKRLSPGYRGLWHRLSKSP